MRERKKVIMGLLENFKNKEDKMITCSKLYKDIPFAHRQPYHDGHCYFIHGHNWDFQFEFGCEYLDTDGFVIDFGKLKFIKEYIENYDHALRSEEHTSELQSH